MEATQLEKVTYLCYIAYPIWAARNMWMFKNIHDSLMRMVIRAMVEVSDFMRAMCLEGSLIDGEN